MINGKSSNRSGLADLLSDILEAAFMRAAQYCERKLDERARKSAAATLNLPIDTSWPDIHQQAHGRSVPQRFRR